jgi:hypothetical protein
MYSKTKLEVVHAERQLIESVRSVVSLLLHPAEAATEGFRTAEASNDAVMCFQSRPSLVDHLLMHGIAGGKDVLHAHRGRAVVGREGGESEARRRRRRSIAVCGG